MKKNVFWFGSGLVIIGVITTAIAFTYKPLKYYYGVGVPQNLGSEWYVLGGLLLTIGTILILYSSISQRSLSETHARSTLSSSLCPNCQSPINDNYVACPHCGSALRKDCPNCHQKNDVEWVTCPFCAYDYRPVRVFTPEPPVEQSIPEPIVEPQPSTVDEEKNIKKSSSKVNYGPAFIISGFALLIVGLLLYFLTTSYEQPDLFIQLLFVDGAVGVVLVVVGSIKFVSIRRKAKLLGE